MGETKCVLELLRKWITPHWLPPSLKLSNEESLNVTILQSETLHRLGNFTNELSCVFLTYLMSLVSENTSETLNSFEFRLKELTFKAMSGLVWTDSHNNFPNRYLNSPFSCLGHLWVCSHDILASLGDQCWFFFNGCGTFSRRISIISSQCFLSFRNPPWTWLPKLTAALLVRDSRWARKTSKE